MYISKKIKILIMAFLSLSIILTACSSNKSPEEKLDEYINNIYSKDYDIAASLSVLVEDQGKIVYKKSFGYSNIDTLEKASPQTNYRLASVTKMFTSMSAMILKDKGLLDYDTKVSDILEDFPDYGKDITVKHLITHMSGLKDYYDLVDLLDEKFDVKNQLLDSDVYEIIKKAESTYFPPGAAFKYSDTGYTLLGLIVEKISGMELSNFMDENIFKPLKMNNTVAYDRTLDMEIKNRAYGTEYVGTKYITRDQSYSSAVLGDGGVYSSLEDLYKWNEGLYGSILVKEETLKEAYTPPRHLNSGYDNYNFGWFFRRNGRGEMEQNHLGGTQGFSTYYLRIPEQKRAIIVLSNRNSYEIAYDLHKYIRKIYNFAKEKY